MAEDPLDSVLRLVAEGRLTAEEAAPILAALDARQAAGADGPADAAPFASGPTIDFRPAGESGRALRIEVRDDGRSVINLRLPLAVGRYAIDRIPGLSGDQVERVRAALKAGMTGPVLVVDDGGDSVRIAIE